MEVSLISLKIGDEGEELNLYINYSRDISNTPTKFPADGSNRFAVMWIHWIDGGTLRSLYYRLYYQYDK